MLPGCTTDMDGGMAMMLGSKYAHSKGSKCGKKCDGKSSLQLLVLVLFLTLVR